MKLINSMGPAAARAASVTGCGVVLCLLGTVASVAQTPGPAAGPPGPGGPRATKPLTAPPAPAPTKIWAFTGNWMNEKVAVGITRPGVAPLRPKYEARLEQLAKLAVAGDEVPGNEPRCIPNGPIMDMNFGMRVLADTQQMTLITNGPRVRYIWLDGRKHTPDDLLFDSYEGESVGHWEGDTLVVDTIGLKGSDEIVFGIPPDNDKLHLVERWKIVSPSTLEIQTTIEDPETLTKPWTFVRHYVRQPLNADVTYCVSATDRQKDGHFDLTPPAGGYIPPGAGN